MTSTGSAGGGPANPGTADPGPRLGAYRDAVDARLRQWQSDGVPRRYWAKDPTFWAGADPESVATRLGWLDLPINSDPLVPEVRELADGVRADGFQHVALMGMGGSSLAPETLARTYGPRPGWPELRVLDSTHPATIARTVPESDVPRTLFIVSSKSGTTLEPNALFQRYWKLASARNSSPGRQFIAITDPGTPLEQLARDKGFRHCFLAPPDVGGRYSALTPFGLVPAGLVGIDIERLLARARDMRDRCGPTVDAPSNPGLWLGAVLGELARAGRDKVVFVPSAAFEPFPPWLEQLIAESLGKRGTGIVPVAGEAEPLDPKGAVDRVLVEFRDPRAGAAAPDRSPAGDATPRLTFALRAPDDLGAEFFRWEFAIAAAGSILGIDPFDQPDVEIAKEMAREAMQGSGASSSGPGAEPVPAGDPSLLGPALAAWIASSRPGDYVAIQAFLDPNDSVRRGIADLDRALRDRLGRATTFGFGPRFLHSTGQLHKGGPPSGLFLQLIDEPTTDLEVPTMPLSFARILRGQADGDAAVLRQRQRRILRVQLGRDVPDALTQLRALLAR